MEQRRNGDFELLVVSLQLQPLLSMADSFAMSVDSAARKLCTFFKMLGADLVLDTRITEDLSLLEHSKELKRVVNQEISTPKLPILSSSCPGFVCYAEKTHGEWILPHISRVKSSQQLMGSIVKHFLASNKSKCCHVTLMPCFDKKLEASRPQFRDEEDRAEVDLVITPVELEEIFRMRQFDLESAQETRLDKLINQQDLKNDENTDFKSDSLVSNEGSGSGGYALHVLRSLCSKDSSADVEYKQQRNADCTELSLGEHRTLVANGFRNIQNVVQKMKRKRTIKSDPLFVEIMACPSGCLNGGAQIRPKEKIEAKIKMDQLNCSFQKLPKRGPEHNKDLLLLYEKWLDKCEKQIFEQIVFTDYKAVEKMDNGLAIKW